MLLLMHNVSSIGLSVACWWLCHSYAQQHERIIATGFAMTGLLALCGMFLRNVPGFLTGIEWQVVGMKTTLAITLMGLVVRRSRTEVKIAQLMEKDCPADLPDMSQWAAQLFERRH